MGKKTVANKKNKQKIKLLFFIIIILIIFFITKNINNTTSKETISLIIDNQDVTEQLENQIIIQEERIYISFEDVKKCLDETIYQEDEKIITTGEKKVALLELNNRDIEINGSQVEIDGQAFQTEEGIIYIPISELNNVYDIEITYTEDTNNIVIDYYSKALVKAYASKNISVKSKASIFSDTIEKISKGNWLIFISEDNGWAKVRTQDGFLGYVKAGKLDNYVTQREDMDQTEYAEDSEYLEKDISEENIEKYENRIDLIEKILIEAVEGEYTSVKIACNNENVGIERFKIEAKPILKECGINISFE